ncbi:hypothetical protein D1007_54044 [Hordeum vulgare]|nr:hypothetical protein D1007_54044 [Hordeum vulgare]
MVAMEFCRSFNGALPGSLELVAAAMKLSLELQWIDVAVVDTAYDDGGAAIERVSAVGAAYEDGGAAMEWTLLLPTLHTRTASLQMSVRFCWGICSYWSSVTRAEVLIAIHDINPEKDKVPLKKVIDACTGCFEQHKVAQQVLEFVRRKLHLHSNTCGFKMGDVMWELKLYMKDASSGEKVVTRTMKRCEICYYNIVNLIEEYGYFAMDYIYIKSYAHGQSGMVELQPESDVLRILREREADRKLSLYVAKYSLGLNTRVDRGDSERSNVMEMSHQNDHEEERVELNAELEAMKRGRGGAAVSLRMCALMAKKFPDENVGLVNNGVITKNDDNTPTKVCTGVTSYKVDNIEKSMDNIASSENDPKAPTSWPCCFKDKSANIDNQWKQKASKEKELPNRQGLQQINSPERDNGFIVYKVENVVESHDNVQTEQNCTKRAPVAHAKDKGHCVKSSSTHHERFEEASKTKELPKASQKN